MWEGWTEAHVCEDYLAYEQFVGENKNVLVEISIIRPQNNPSMWKVEVAVSSVMGGLYVSYEELFDSFAEAEAKAWEEAQKRDRRR